MFQNHWRKCELRTSSSFINRGVLHWDERLCFELWVLRLGLFASMSEILNSCAWLLLFEVLRETPNSISFSGRFLLSFKNLYERSLMWPLSFLSQSCNVRKISRDESSAFNSTEKSITFKTTFQRRGLYSSSVHVFFYC